MEKVLKLLKKPFSERDAVENEALIESLRHQSFLKPFFPDSNPLQNAFLKLCLFLLKYRTYTTNEIVYNSGIDTSKHIFFIIYGKATIFEIKTSVLNENLDIQNLITSTNNKTLHPSVISSKVIEKYSSFGAFSENVQKNYETVVLSQTPLDVIYIEQSQYLSLFLMKSGSDSLKIPLLKGIFPDKTPIFYIYAISSLISERTFKRNCWVYKEKEKNIDNFYLIKKGIFRIFKHFYSENKRQTYCLCEIGPGEMFGLEGLLHFLDYETNLNSREYSVNVVSSDTSSVYVFNINQLKIIRSELISVSTTLKNIIEMKEIWISNRINSIQNELTNMKIKIPIEKIMTKEEKNHIKEGNKIFQILNIRKTIEKHFEAFKLKNQKSDIDQQLNELRNNRGKSPNNEITRLLNENKDPKIKILPKIFLPFDTFFLEQRKKRSNEEIKNEIMEQIKKKSWGFDKTTPVTLQKKECYYSPRTTPRSPHRQKKIFSNVDSDKKSLSPNNTQQINIKKVYDKMRVKRWKSP